MKSNECRSSNCPFCREPLVDDEEVKKRIMERVKANDPAAMVQMGNRLYHEGDHGKALEYWEKAAKLGNSDAHWEVAGAYLEGEGVEKDGGKAVYHAEQAAIGGHHAARHNLGCTEAANGRMDRAVKHFIIAANLGYEKSMKKLWKQYADGNVTKEDLDATLRTHQAAINEMKSEDRDLAEKFDEWSSKMGYL